MWNTCTSAVPTLEGTTRIKQKKTEEKRKQGRVKNERIPKAYQLTNSAGVPSAGLWRHPGYRCNKHGRENVSQKTATELTHSDQKASTFLSSLFVKANVR